MDKILRQTYLIQTYDVDLDGKIHLPQLLNFLQDAARIHAGRLKFSVFDLQKKGLTWVVSRYHIRLSDYPSMGDTIEVSTWTSGRDGFFALREFEARTADGRLFLEATSSWMIISLDTKQPVRIDTSLPEDCFLERRAIDDSFPRLPSPESYNGESRFRVLRRDLDFNRHANNVAYVHWALEAVPEEIARAGRPVDIEIVYKAEAFAGDEILSRVKVSGSPYSTVLHQIVNGNSGSELARLRTVWKPIRP